MIELPPSASTPEAIAEPAALGAPDRPRIEAQVEARRVAILHELTSLPVIAGMAFAVLVASVLWRYRPPLIVGSWLAFKFVIGTSRLLETRRYFARRQMDGDAPAWRRRSLLLLLLDAMVWGSMGVLFMPADAPGIRAVMLASLIGIAGVGVFSYASDARGCVLFLCTLLLPTALLQAGLGTDEGWFAALGVVLYLALMCLEAVRSEARVVQMLRLRFENAWIAEERQRAMRLSEHANAAKSRFLATVSHEMRTPLNGILGMTQMLQRSSLDAEQRAQLEIVHDSSRHLQTVIGDLLDLSRIEFGKLAIDERPFALADTVQEVTGLLGAIAADKGLRFEFDWSAGLPAWVVGDASRVKQVLHNLLGNAIKFTVRGEVRLTVRRHDHQLSFTVCDSGDGVPVDMRETIFHAFEQGPSATLQGRNGTGLGLTISRHLARAMGGDVRCVEPPSAGGACFVFTMACRIPLAEPVFTREQHEPIDTPLTGRVLVVDDNPVNALVATAMLKRAGLDVEVAEDGLSALDRMHLGGIDLVLMDCQLPLLDGWEATRRWRRTERPGRRLPIVALTANAVLGDRERCLAAGMDDYLPKPVDMEALIACVTRLLQPGALQQAG